MDKLIYLDNAATTKTSPEVVEAMLPYFTEHYGNPSSIYSFAAANKEVISKQRETIAGVIGAKENEIYFTAGGNLLHFRGNGSRQLGIDGDSRGVWRKRKAYYYDED